jgi:Spy/CpxP family protein refolding chaperone
MNPRSHFANSGLLAAALVLAGPLLAVEGSSPSPSPYVGLESRKIPAVSPEREKGLLAGAGIGYAMAAELNGHPGPKHVLEMSEQLALTEAQRAAAQASFERMRTDAVALGEQILAAEELLNRRFAHRHIDEATLAELTSQIATLEGKLRFVHLRAHLETDALLTEAQRQRYVELRGYGKSEAGAQEHHHSG